MKKHGILSIVILLTIFIGMTNAKAVNYISPTPFYQQVSGVSVQPVSKDYIYQGITWGDMILALGNISLFPGGVKLVDDPLEQIKNVISGKTPFIRQTVGSGTMLVDALQSVGVKMEIFHSVTDSNGGDVVVTRSFNNINEFVTAVKGGKTVTVAIQYGGPHMGWLVDLLTKNGLSITDINIKYLPNLFGDDSPETAIAEDQSIDMAFVISPSAATLTEGTAAIPGLSILVTTKAMNESIKDIILVRSDWAKDNKAQLKKIREGFLSAAKTKLLDGNLVKEAATIMFGSASHQNIADTEGLRDDARFHNMEISNNFMYSPTNPNNFPRKVARIVGEFKKVGLVSNGDLNIPVTDWNVKVSQEAHVLQADKEVTARIEQEVSELKKSGQGQVLFSDKILFEPNQNSFTVSEYGKNFDAVINYANTYPGAVLNIVGHVDPSLLRGWNKAIEFKKSGNNTGLMKVEAYLNKVLKSNYNLAQMSIQRITMERNNVQNAAERTSKERANAVKAAIVDYAIANKIDLQAYKLVVHGDGAGSPIHERPKNQAEFDSNIRVEFNVTNYNAEIQSFEAVQDF